jgi:hypothetical protein
MTGYTFDQLFDFTRTTAGTFVGSNGLIQNTPASVNLLLYTQEFDNAAWVKSSITVTANDTVAPDGTATADLLTQGGGGTAHSITQTFTGTSAAYTFTIYVKKGTRRFAVLALTPAAGPNIADYAWFDLDTGARGSMGANLTSSSITPAGSGWFRISVTKTLAAASQFALVTHSEADNSLTSSAAGTTFAWGAQLELGSTATTYTRNNGGLFPARFDYDPVTLAPRGILIEEQRTNLLLNSVFSGAVSGSPGTAPTSWGSFANGTITVTSLGRNFAANSIRIVTSSARHFYSQVVALSATGTWMVTFKVDVTTARSLFELLGFNTTPAGATTQYFYNNVAQASSFVPPTGAGLLQVAITTTGTSGNAEVRFGCGVSTTGTADVTFWDAQWELGTFATSYIPTVASQVTRSADLCTITAPMFAPWYNQTESTFVVEASSINNNTGTRRMPLALSDAAITFQQNKISPMYDAGSFNVFSLWVFGTASGVLLRPSPNVAEPAVGVTSKIAFTVKSSDTAAAISGNTPGISTTAYPASLPMQLLRMGNENILDGQGDFSGHIRRITYYPFRASNNQLQALTT